MIRVSLLERLSTGSRHHLANEYSQRSSREISITREIRQLIPDFLKHMKEGTELH